MSILTRARLTTLGLTVLLAAQALASGTSTAAAVDHYRYYLVIRTQFYYGDFTNTGQLWIYKKNTRSGLVTPVRRVDKAKTFNPVNLYDVRGSHALIAEEHDPGQPGYNGLEDFNLRTHAIRKIPSNGATSATYTSTGDDVVYENTDKAGDVQIWSTGINSTAPENLLYTMPRDAEPGGLTAFHHSSGFLFSEVNAYKPSKVFRCSSVVMAGACHVVMRGEFWGLSLSWDDRRFVAYPAHGPGHGHAFYLVSTQTYKMSKPYKERPATQGDYIFLDSEINWTHDDKVLVQQNMDTWSVRSHKVLAGKGKGIQGGSNRKGISKLPDAAFSTTVH